MKNRRLPKFKKETLYLFAAGIACVLLLAGTLLLLNSHLKSSATTDVSKIDPSRSQVMVTGEGYHAKRGKKSEQEEKRESRTRSDKSKAWKKAAPNSQNRKRSESRTGKIIRSDAGGEKGKGGRTPGKISPKKPSGTPDDSAKTPSDDANTETKKKKREKNKGKNNRDKDNPTTEDPKAPIISINFKNVEKVQNNITYIKGTFLSFSLSATTYKGEKVERSEKFVVTLNGDKMYSSGDRYVGLYSAKIDSGGGSKLKTGLNRIVASVTDTEGNKTTETHRIVMDASQEGEKEGVATVSFDLKQLGIEKSPIGTSKVTINDGEKVAHVVKRYFEINGVKIQGTESEDYGFYLKRVYKKNITKGIPKKIREKYFPPPDYEPFEKDSLGAKDFGQESGWKYNLNGETPNVGMSSKEAHDGDEIIIWYTLKL